MKFKKFSLEAVIAASSNRRRNERWSGNTSGRLKKMEPRLSKRGFHVDLVVNNATLVSPDPVIDVRKVVSCHRKHKTGTAA